MTMQQIQYYLALMQYRNFSIAAEECFISQSSFSKQIKALEQELGDVKLIDRSGRRLKITEAGEEFGQFAQSVDREYERIRRKMKKYTEKPLESVNIGAIPILDQYGISECMYRFQDKNPEIELHMWEKTSKQIVDDFIRGDVDVAVLWENWLPEPVQNLEIYPILSDELVLAVPNTHPFAGREEVDLLEASGEQFLLMSPDTSMHRFCRQLCFDSGFIPKTMDLDVRCSTIVKLVGNGYGITFLLSQFAKEKLSPDIRQVRLKQRPSFRLVMTTRKEEKAEALQAFLEYVLSQYKRRVNDTSHSELESAAPGI